MRSERGYTLIEVLITVGLIGVVTAISVPVFIESSARTNIWTASERIGATIRQTRLKAISQNTVYRVHFACPSAGDLRTLVVTGVPAVDDDFPGRCSEMLEGDTDVMELPAGVSYDHDGVTYLQVTGRGVFTAVGGAIPLEIGVQHGISTRTLTVSATGQISFSDVH
jgi:prepilin-type N-terminal cleavage/methylation domain-containing protein